MASSIPINKKSFYGGVESGESPDIAMPPLGQVPPIQATSPDLWSSQAQVQTDHANIMAPVPDHVPLESIQETEQSQEISTETQGNPETIEEVTPQPKRLKAQPPISENIIALREAREKAERERDELLRFLQMQQVQQQTQQKPPEPAPDSFDIQDDALIEGKQFRQMYNEIKELRKQVSETQQQTRDNLSRAAETVTETRIKTAYPDFDKVVSKENIEALKEQYPELAQTLHSTADLYSKAVSVYTLIKQFGFYKDPVFENDRLKALKNSNKPRPLASVSPQHSDSPLTRANAFASGELTEEMKAQYRREMYQSRKNM